MEYGLGGNRFEQFLRDAERSTADVNEVKSRIAEVVGRGEAMDGRIKAEFNSSDGLAALHLDPRALRMQSEELSAEIRIAVNAASKDFQNRLSHASAAMFGIPTDPFDLMQEPAMDADKMQEHARAQAAKLGDAFAGQMKEVLRELGVQQQRAKEARDRYRAPGQGTSL
jgi:DNA-binding protein YbaB